jgi:hypothetical protein
MQPGRTSNIAASSTLLMPPHQPFINVPRPLFVTSTTPSHSRSDPAAGRSAVSLTTYESSLVELHIFTFNAQIPILSPEIAAEGVRFIAAYPDYGVSKYRSETSTSQLPVDHVERCACAALVWCACAIGACAVQDSKVTLYCDRAAALINELVEMSRSLSAVPESVPATACAGVTKSPSFLLIRACFALEIAHRLSNDLYKNINYESCGMYEQIGRDLMLRGGQSSSFPRTGVAAVSAAAAADVGGVHQRKYGGVEGVEGVEGVDEETVVLIHQVSLMNYLHDSNVIIVCDDGDRGGDRQLHGRFSAASAGAGTSIGTNEYPTLRSAVEQRGSGELLG